MGRSWHRSWVPKFPFSSVETQTMEGGEQCASSQSRHRWAAQLNSSPDNTLASKLGYLVPFWTPWGVQSVQMGLTCETWPFWSDSWGPGLDLRHLRGHRTAMFTKLPPTLDASHLQWECRNLMPMQTPRCAHPQFTAFGSNRLLSLSAVKDRDRRTSEDCKWKAVLQERVGKEYLNFKCSHVLDGLSFKEVVTMTWHLHTWCLQDRGTNETRWNSNYWKYCWVCKQCLQFQQKVFNHSIIINFSSEFNVNNISLHLVAIVDLYIYIYIYGRMLHLDL